MSWLARSISDSLRLDDDDHRHLQNDAVSSTSSSTVSVTDANGGPPTATCDDVFNNNASPSSSQSQSQQGDEREHSDDDLQSRGMKEDLNELKQTLTKQLWGVASFLAPPIPPPLPPPPNQLSKSRGDLERSEMRIPNSAEIGVGLNYSGSESEIEEDEGEEQNYGNGAVGITEEVVAFAMNISMHPETWLDFPLDPDEDLDDFEMSPGQEEHAFAITQLSPQFNALRIELCPCHMNESYFWKVYFVLLHSRLHKQDSEILSTTQVMEARAMWMKELQKQTKPETDWFGRSTSHLKDELHEDFYHQSNYTRSGSFSPRIYTFEPTTSSMTKDYNTEKHLSESSEVHFVDKSVIEEKPLTKPEEKDIFVLPCSKISIPIFEDDDDDDWPEEDSDLEGYSGNVVCNAEDYSFSDLEVDDDVRFPIAKSKTVTNKT